MPRKWFQLTLSLSMLLIFDGACSRSPFSEPEASLDSFKLYFSDFESNSDGGLKTALLEVINSSSFSLDCAFSQLVETDVIHAIVAKHNSGIKVRIGFDEDSKTSDSGSVALAAAGLVQGSGSSANLYYGNKGEGVMRHNFCVADGRLVFMTTSGIESNQLSKRPQIGLRIGSDEFGIGREFVKEITLFQQGLFGIGKNKFNFTTKFVIFDQVIEVQWGPHENPMDFLGLELNDAESKIEMFTTSFQKTNTDVTLDLINILNSKVAAGLTVSALLDSGALFESNSKFSEMSTSISKKQYFNSLSGPGLQIMIIDRGTPGQRVIFYTGSLRSKADSSDDGVILSLKGEFATNTVGAYLDRIAAQSEIISANPTDITVQDQAEVVINEIMWQGSYTDSASTKSADEYIELYNRTGNKINISNWKFACTTNGTSTNAFITMPAGAVIPANSYFVIADHRDGATSGAHYTSNALDITDASHQCVLTDGDTTDNAGGIFSNSSFTGTIVDRAGDGATAFNSSRSALSSRLGFSSLSPSYDGVGKRSMERINLGSNTDGTNITNNWISNILPSGENTLIAGGY